MRREIPETYVADLPEKLPEGLVVLDVREDDEWAAGHIDGSLHIRLMEVPQRSLDLPADRQVLVVCKVGGRSAQATAYLHAQGVEAVNLADGMKAWHASGRPMVSDSGSQPRVL